MAIYRFLESKKDVIKSKRLDYYLVKKITNWSFRVVNNKMIKKLSRSSNCS